MQQQDELLFFVIKNNGAVSVA